MVGDFPPKLDHQTLKLVSFQTKGEVFRLQIVNVDLKSGFWLSRGGWAEPSKPLSQVLSRWEGLLILGFLDDGDVVFFVRGEEGLREIDGGREREERVARGGFS